MQILSEHNKEVIVKRGKSFLWSVGSMVAALLLAEASSTLELLVLPEYLVIAIGLGLAQLTKLLNNSPK